MIIEKTLGKTVYLDTDFDSALAQVAEVLKNEGFGILTEIDVRATLKKKLDVDFRPYRILGACNPPLAHQALSASPEVGLLLPCNVTVSQIQSGQVEVSFLDPLKMLGILNDPAIQSIAADARERLDRAASALAEA